MNSPDGGGPADCLGILITGMKHEAPQGMAGLGLTPPNCLPVPPFGGPECQDQESQPVRLVSYPTILFFALHGNSEKFSPRPVAR